MLSSLRSLVAGIDRYLRPERDLRIDLARGSALVIIFLDHVLGNPVAKWTLRRFGFVDALDVFVFLSGFSLGYIYTKELKNNGYQACLKRASSRCRTLYFAHIVAAVSLLCLLLLFARKGAYIPHTEVYTIIHAPVATLAHLVTLSHVPFMLVILPVYIIFTACTPFTLKALSTRPFWVAGLSLAIYAFAQVFPDVNLRSFPENQAWTWNILGWQFLFFLSLLAGRAKAEGVAITWISNRYVVTAGIVGLLTLFCARHATTLSHWGERIHVGGIIASLKVSLPATEKMTDHPLRLLNLVLLIVVGRAVFSSPTLLKAACLRPVLLCGQRPLPVFIVGVLLSSGVNLVTQESPQSPAFWASVNVAGVMILVLSALFAAWLSQQKFVLVGKLRGVALGMLQQAADSAGRSLISR
jgi:hypothetical protein